MASPSGQSYATHHTHTHTTHPPLVPSSPVTEN